MPRQPKTPCRWRGCPALVEEGFCPQHRAHKYREYNERRRRSPDVTDAFYKTAAWVKLRNVHAALEPLCRACSKRGVVRAMRVVDHVVPIREGGAALDDDNLQSLCNPCNAAKTAKDLKRLDAH